MLPLLAPGGAGATAAPLLPLEGVADASSGFAKEKEGLSAASGACSGGASSAGCAVAISVVVLPASSIKGFSATANTASFESASSTSPSGECLRGCAFRRALRRTKSQE